MLGTVTTWEEAGASAILVGGLAADKSTAAIAPNIATLSGHNIVAATIAARDEYQLTKNSIN